MMSMTMSTVAPLRVFRTASRNSHPRTSLRVRAEVAEGSKVRVTDDVKVFHIPKSKGAETNLKGFEGIVQTVIKEHNGHTMSANLPVRVKLTGEVANLGEVSFIAHLAANEFEEC